MKIPIRHLEPPSLRHHLDQHIVGRGLELGPGHVPYPVPPEAEVLLVDQWTSDENRVLFYELESGVTFPKPDIIANLDTDRLHGVERDSQDFVIASHVLEHLAEPVGMLVDAFRVLRPGGKLLILLPDRRRTFDRTRYGTGLAHTIAEYEQGVDHVDDDHVVEFIVHADHPIHRKAGNEPEPITAELIEAHRMRSVHAHCWTEDEFLDVLLYCQRELGLGFRLVDGISSRAGRRGIEFGFVLEKCAVPDGDASEELLATWDSIVGRQELTDRWPLGRILALALAELGPVDPPAVGAVHDVIDLVLHRADLTQAFAADELDLTAALAWASGVAAGTTADDGAALLRPHAAALRDLEVDLVDHPDPRPARSSRWRARGTRPRRGET